MAHSKLVQKVTSATTRNLAVAVVPAAYALGYFLWSFYSASQKLGFLPLSHPQYLVAGLVFGIYCVATVWIPLRVAQGSIKSNKKWRMEPAKSIVHLVTLAIVGSIVNGLFLMIFSSFSVLHLSEEGVYKFVLMPAIVVGIAIMLAAFLWLLQTGTNWFTTLVLWLPSKFLKERTASETATERETFAPVPMAYAGLVLGVVVFSALFLLPIMKPEFGGAEPRRAVLDLRPGDVSLETRAWLFDNVTDNQTVVQTREITVLFVAHDFILVRGDVPNAPVGHFEIQRQVIRSILWKTW